MKQYIGTKVILARPMTRLDYNVYRSWALPANENGDDEGYLVEYLDGGKPNHTDHEGYISWSPAEQFDNAYREPEGLTFGEALEALKIGQRVARYGWNGKGMYVYHVPAAEYLPTTEVAREEFGDQPVPYRAYLALMNPDRTISTWAPSVSDALAEDWFLA